jgi:hypothetical protein
LADRVNLFLKEHGATEFCEYIRIHKRDGTSKSRSDRRRDERTRYAHHIGYADGSTEEHMKKEVLSVLGILGLSLPCAAQCRRSKNVAWDGAAREPCTATLRRDSSRGEIIAGGLKERPSRTIGTRVLGCLNHRKYYEIGADRMVRGATITGLPLRKIH